MTGAENKGGRGNRVPPEVIQDVLVEGDEPFLSTGEIAEKAGVSRPTAIDRLKELEEAGEVKKREFGNAPIWYLPEMENRRLTEYLDEEDGVGPRELKELVQQYGSDTLHRAAELVEQLEKGEIETLETVASALERGADEDEILAAAESGALDGEEVSSRYEKVRSWIDKAGTAQDETGRIGFITLVVFVGAELSTPPEWFYDLVVVALVAMLLIWIALLIVQILLMSWAAGEFIKRESEFQKVFSSGREL